jgi:hypothetical protein
MPQSALENAEADDNKWTNVDTLTASSVEILKYEKN